MVHLFGLKEGKISAGTSRHTGYLNLLLEEFLSHFWGSKHCHCNCRQNNARNMLKTLPKAHFYCNFCLPAVLLVILLGGCIHVFNSSGILANTFDMRNIEEIVFLPEGSLFGRRSFPASSFINFSLSPD